MNSDTDAYIGIINCERRYPVAIVRVHNKTRNIMSRQKIR